MKRISTTLILALIVAYSATANAFDYRVELGGFLGGHFFSDSNGLGRYKGDTPDNQISSGALLGIRLGFVVHPRLVIEGELGLSPTSTANNVQVLAIGYRLHLLVHLLTGRVRPFILAGGGGFTSSSANSMVLQQDTDGELHVGVGLKVDIQKGWGLRVDGRVQFSPAISGIYFTEDYEVTAGIYGLFEHVKEVKKPAPKVEPPAPADTDKDGVPDAIDKCPTSPGPIDNGGCPDTDTDGDKVIDRLDKCPKDAGPVENGGCPDTDGDGDGIVDRLDKCPTQAGPIENGGCPDVDLDKDGIIDRLDKCPDKAETMNGYEDEDGCPDEIPPGLQKVLGVVDGLLFDKAAIQKKSFAVLDQVAAVLTEHAKVRVQIVGYTDSVGDREVNVQLSQGRADAVKAYLVGKGIAADRMHALGAGPDRPIGDNTTVAGKAKNRRVEIRLYKK